MVGVAGARIMMFFIILCRTRALGFIVFVVIVSLSLFLFPVFRIVSRISIIRFIFMIAHMRAVAIVIITIVTFFVVVVIAMFRSRFPTVRASLVIIVVAIVARGGLPLSTFIIFIARIISRRFPLVIGGFAVV